ILVNLLGHPYDWHIDPTSDVNCNSQRYLNIVNLKGPSTYVANFSTDEINVFNELSTIKHGNQHIASLENAKKFTKSMDHSKILSNQTPIGTLLKLGYLCNGTIHSGVNEFGRFTIETFIE
ncbi:MAG: hypothetical protein AAF153_00530, partial [Pseudomonadota bacterium]